MLWFSLSAVAGPSTVLLGFEQAPPEVARVGGELVACFASSRVCLVEGAPPEALARLPGVRYAERDREMALAGAPAVVATAECPDPHELVTLGVEGAWAEVCGAGAPVVAVQDSGFRPTHVDLAGRIVGGWDYGDGDDRPEVTWLSGVPEHGTFVAGVVAANADAVGRTGVAPEAALFLQKIADSSGALYFSYAVAAMDDLATNHPEVGVLNYSIASLSPPAAFEDAVAALGAADVVVVAAAANCPVPSCFDADNDTYPVYPASYDLPHVVAVASQRPDGTLDPYSHYGATSVALAAPGADVCSLGVQSDTQWLVASGTSYATPEVAGIAALVREAYPRLTAPEVLDVLCASAEPVPALDGLVRCGSARADAALATPVAHLVDVPDLEVAGAGTWTLAIDSLAAAGEATLELELPAGLVAVDGAPSVVVALPADGPLALALAVEALADGAGEGTARLVTPTSGGEAWSFSIVARLPEAPTEPTPSSEPTTGDEPVAPSAPAEAPGGCGCATTAPGGWSRALALVSRR